MHSNHIDHCLTADRSHGWRESSSINNILRKVFVWLPISFCFPRNCSLASNDQGRNFRRDVSSFWFVLHHNRRRPVWHSCSKLVCDFSNGIPTTCCCCCYSVGRNHFISMSGSLPKEVVKRNKNGLTFEYVCETNQVSTNHPKCLSIPSTNRHVMLIQTTYGRFFCMDQACYRMCHVFVFDGTNHSTFYDVKGKWMIFWWAKRKRVSWCRSWWALGQRRYRRVGRPSNH